MIRISDKAEPAFFIEPLNKQKGGFRFSFGNVYACLLVGTRDCFKCNIQRPAPPGLPFLCRQERRYLWVMTRVVLGNALSLEIVFPPPCLLVSLVPVGGYLRLRSTTSCTRTFPNAILVITHKYGVRNWLSSHEVCVGILKGFYRIAQGCGTPLPWVG